MFDAPEIPFEALRFAAPQPICTLRLQPSCRNGGTMAVFESLQRQGAHQPKMVSTLRWLSLVLENVWKCMKRHSYSWQLKDSQFRKCGLFTADAVLGFWDLLPVGIRSCTVARQNPATTNIPVLDSISRIRFKYFSVKMFEPQQRHRIWNAWLWNHPSSTWGTIPAIVFGQIYSGYNDASPAPRIAKPSQAFSELPGHRWLHRSISLGKVAGVLPIPSWGRWPLTIWDGWEVGALTCVDLFAFHKLEGSAGRVGFEADSRTPKEINELVPSWIYPKYSFSNGNSSWVRMPECGWVSQSILPHFFPVLTSDAANIKRLVWISETWNPRSVGKTIKNHPHFGWWFLNLWWFGDGLLLFQPHYQHSNSMQGTCGTSSWRPESALSARATCAGTSGMRR